MKTPSAAMVSRAIKAIKAIRTMPLRRHMPAAWGLVPMLVLACGLGAPVHAGAQTDQPHALQQRLAARIVGDRTGACLVAALIETGHVVRAQACAGTRRDPAPPDGAVFEIGSVSKTMTAFLVQHLVSRGQWTLDDPVAQHLPAQAQLPRQGERQILVRDLLTHSSGLPALPPGMPVADARNPYASLSEAQLLAALPQVTLTRPIGSQMAYSNFGMMLLSLAVARSLGGDLDAALRTHLFDPLGMAQAHVAAARGAPAAQGHLPTGEPAPAWTITPNLAGVGMVKASLDDMVRYARAQLGDGPPAQVALMHQTQQPLAHGVAMAWMPRTLQGHALVMHEGGTGGFSALVVLVPGERRAIVLLADTGLTDTGGLAELGLSLLGLDMPPQRPRLAVETPAAWRQALAGDYELAGRRLTIRAQGERLVAQAAGQGAFELRLDSHGDFYPLGFSALLKPPAGHAPAEPVGHFTWLQMGGRLEGRRVTPGAAPSAAPAGTVAPPRRDWAGEYQLTPSFSVQVFEQDGQTMVQGSGQAPLAAEVIGPDRIEVASVGAVLAFVRDADGQVVGVVLSQGGQRLQGTKTPKAVGR